MRNAMLLRQGKFIGIFYKHQNEAQTRHKREHYKREVYFREPQGVPP
jgi:hypothetical protein